MNVPQVIKVLLDTINRHSDLLPGTFAAFGGTVGNIGMLQKEINMAIMQWRDTHDTTGLVQVTKTLHAYGNLTDTEYQQIMNVLDGEN